jgi:hypothetical protein
MEAAQCLPEARCAKAIAFAAENVRIGAGAAVSRSLTVTEGEGR